MWRRLPRRDGVDDFARWDEVKIEVNETMKVSLGIFYVKHLNQMGWHMKDNTKHQQK